MKSDRIRWNEKYKTKSHPTDPSPILKKYYPLAPGGRALDIAAGNGRHALFLADHGFTVDAVDISEKGLTIIPRRHPRLNRICADLDLFDIPADRYSLIVNIRFLNRRLFPYIIEGLIGGGLLIFETYLDNKENGEEGPLRRDHRLEPNELLHAFLPLRIRYYREGAENRQKHAASVASLVGIKII